MTHTIGHCKARAKRGLLLPNPHLPCIFRCTMRRAPDMRCWPLAALGCCRAEEERRRQLEEERRQRDEAERRERWVGLDSACLVHRRSGRTSTDV